MFSREWDKQHSERRTTIRSQSDFMGGQHIYTYDQDGNLVDSVYCQSDYMGGFNCR